MNLAKVVAKNARVWDLPKRDTSHRRLAGLNLGFSGRAEPRASSHLNPLLVSRTNV